MTVPMAPDHSTTMLVAKSQKPTSVAAGSGKNARTAIRLENANGQISRGLFRLATAAPTKVTNATRALKGRIRKPAEFTLIHYTLGARIPLVADGPQSTHCGHLANAAKRDCRVLGATMPKLNKLRNNAMLDPATARDFLVKHEIDPVEVTEVSHFPDGSMSIIMKRDEALWHLGIEHDASFALEVARALQALGIRVERRIG